MTKAEKILATLESEVLSAKYGTKNRSVLLLRIEQLKKAINELKSYEAKLK